jgi:hypothetical protein
MPKGKTQATADRLYRVPPRIEHGPSADRAHRAEDPVSAVDMNSPAARLLYSISAALIDRGQPIIFPKRITACTALFHAFQNLRAALTTIGDGWQNSGLFAP